MKSITNKGGRPEISEIQKEEILRKLQPYLQSGISISKALQEVHIPPSTFYDLMKKDQRFSDKITRFKNFLSILVNNIITKEIMMIADKQNGNPAKGIRPQSLSKEDRKFLWRFALNSNLTKEEFGRRNIIKSFNPEAEIQRVKRIIDESTTEEIYHI